MAYEQIGGRVMDPKSIIRWGDMKIEQYSTYAEVGPLAAFAVDIAGFLIGIYLVTGVSGWISNGIAIFLLIWATWGLGTKLAELGRRGLIWALEHVVDESEGEA